MATTQTLAPADPKHYVWWFPGSPIKVHLDLQVVQRLKERLGDPGTEISEEGLLFGRVHDGTAEILDFQPASNSNVPDMIAALNEQSKRSLMGYYRTEEGETFRLNANDISLAEECFRKPHQVFLMIHSNGFGAPNATFFFHEGERKMADFAFLEFPFDASLLGIEERDRIQRSHHAAVEHSVTVSRSLDPPVVSIPRNKSRVLLKAAGGACLIALVFALGASVNSRSFRERLTNLQRKVTNRPAIDSPSSPVSQPASLPSMALHAKRQNADLELTWNRDSTSIATATSGLILIQDGGSERRIPLDSTQVRGGSLLYSPTSDQILMQLTITTSAGNITESVMVILPKAGIPQTYPLPASKTSSVSAVPVPLSSEIVELAKPSKPFTQPSTAKGTLSLPPLIPIDSPPLKVNPYSPATVAPAFVSQASVPLPPATLLPNPVTPSYQPSITVKYQPAVVIRKVAPTFPPELRNLTVKRNTVEVKVFIDKTGHVSKAEAVPQKNVSQFLVNSAVHAALLWSFQPARRGDEPVSSESLLEFVFGH